MIILDRNVRQRCGVFFPLFVDDVCCPHSTRYQLIILKMCQMSMHVRWSVCLFVFFWRNRRLRLYRRCTAVKTTFDKIYGWPIYTHRRHRRHSRTAAAAAATVVTKWAAKHALPSFANTNRMELETAECNDIILSLSQSVLSKRRKNNIKMTLLHWPCARCALKKYHQRDAHQGDNNLCNPLSREWPPLNYLFVFLLLFFS